MARWGTKSQENTDVTENDAFADNSVDAEVYPTDEYDESDPHGFADDAPAETPAAPAAFDPNALVFEDSDEPLPARTRKSAANPYAGIVANSLETGRAKKTPALPNDEIVKDVTGLLRRAAADAGHGIEIRAVSNDAGTVLHFQSKPEKRSRAYTVDDVRDWARANGYTEADLLPRVGPYVSNAYREAHDMKVNKTS